ncbi:MAG: heavy-metal-associated domain-containing protein [Patescibacteria group bacterium]
MNKSARENLKDKIIIFKIIGMHCVSCAMNIDGNLEDTQGVTKAETNFAKSTTKVFFNSKKVMPERLKKIIEETGYSVIEKFNLG